jgi:acyl dehydratase
MSRIDSIDTGDSLPELVHEPNEVQLFLFSAVTWNPHRIHYDREYALSEGHAGVVVQTHLHGCLLIKAIREGLGPVARLESIAWENRRVAVAGDRLTVSGRVSAVRRQGDQTSIVLTLEERNQDGQLCVKGSASVVVPERALPERRDRS